jgi:beta-lactamase class A
MNNKIKNLFYTLIVFVVTFIPNVFAADWDFCEVKGPLQVMKAAGVAIYIAKIIVPIFLILMGSVELIKVVISGDDKSFKSSINNLVKKFVAGILIFFLPTIVFLVLGMIAGATEYYNSFTNCNVCFNHPNSDECKALIESALEDFPENSKMKNPSNTQYSTNTSNSGGTSSSTNSNSDDSANTIDDPANTIDDISSNSGNWAILYGKIGNSSYYSSVKNEKINSPMIAASLIKLYIMATVYDEINKGKINEADVNTNLDKMITVSDNTAANSLIDTLSKISSSNDGMALVNNYAVENGYSATKLNRKLLEFNGKENYTSVLDCYKILTNIYNGTCVNSIYSQKMLNLILNQTFKNKIRAGLPSGVKAGNKTGELPGKAQNDVAIIYLPNNGAYILSVMSESSDDNSAISSIVKISTSVYDYMIK